MEIVTGLRKTPALPIRVNPRNPWFEPPFEDPDWKTATRAKQREQPTEPEVAFPIPLPSLLRVVDCMGGTSSFPDKTPTDQAAGALGQGMEAVEWDCPIRPP